MGGMDYYNFCDLYECDTHTKISTKLIWPSTFMLLGNRLFHEAFYYFSNIVYFHYSDYKGCIEEQKNEKVNIY